VGFTARERCRRGGGEGAGTRKKGEEVQVTQADVVSVMFAAWRRREAKKQRKPCLGVAVRSLLQLGPFAAVLAECGSRPVPSVVGECRVSRVTTVLHVTSMCYLPLYREDKRQHGNVLTSAHSGSIWKTV